MKRSIPWLFIFFTVNIQNAHTQSIDTVSYLLPDVVITANRIPTNALQSSRVVEVIDSKTIGMGNFFSVEQILQSSTTIDIHPRGPFGVQTDIGIRGGTFSQSAILLDGIRLNDAQTAHHNFDLPISLHQLERVEIMKGPGSTLYGSDADGGVINLISKEPEAVSGSLQISGGENGFAAASTQWDMISSAWKSTTAVDYRSSRGYRYDTDFSVWDASSNNFFRIADQRFKMMLGYGRKEFGAFDFYSPGRNIPSKEWTSVGFASLGTDVLVASTLLQPRLYIRRHDDKFMFDIRTPDLYVNTHQTNSYGGQLVASSTLSESISLVGGLEEQAETIESSKLGSHSRSTFGIFFNVRKAFEERVRIDIGAREDVTSISGASFNPSVGMGYTVSASTVLFANAARSFRIPSYTELYYSDPANVGNANLQPEIGWSYEIGMRHLASDNLRMSGSLFLRDQTNLIDYVQYSQTDIYHAVNLTTARVRGFECTGEWTATSRQGERFEIQSAKLGYTYLDSEIDRKGAYRSKYTLAHPRHQILAAVSFSLPSEIFIQVSSTTKYKTDADYYTLMDITATKHTSMFDVSLTGTNMLNKTYEEIVGVPLPGRWMIASVKWKIW